MTETATSPLTAAPETKHVPDTMTAAFEDFMGAFESFKETNDCRLAEIEGKLTADVVTRDKMDRISRAMDEQKRTMDQMLLKKARPALGRDDYLSPEAEEHKAAFESYVRRGDEQAICQPASLSGSRHGLRGRPDRLRASPRHRSFSRSTGTDDL